MEWLIYNGLTEFLGESMSSAQFGFRRNHSTVQQLLLFYNHMMRDSTSASQWDVLFLDFAKAFDKVLHKEVLVKLRKLGVSGDVWLWLESYLSKRTQYVCIEGCCSQLLPVVSSVPQGSILGPLLFLVFVNDLPAVVQHSLILMFADDTKCGKLVRSPLDSFQLQADLDAMCSCMV